MADKRIVTIDYLESNYVKNTDINQSYDPLSEKAASGKAVNEAISGIQPIDENTEFIFDGGDVDGGVSVDIVVDTVLSKTSNNPIANKPVAIKFGEILGAIDTLENMVHIVESGTSGIWSYRKWSDGTAECWGRIDYNMGTFNTQSGSLYIADNLCEFVNYPSHLFIEAPVEVASAIAGNYAIWLAPWDGAGTKDHTAQYKAIRTSSTSSTSLRGYISLIAKGKWSTKVDNTPKYVWKRTA